MNISVKSNKKRSNKCHNILIIIVLQFLLINCDKNTEQNSPEFWYEKGYSLDELGHYEEAILAYDEAIELKPNYLYAWLNKGVDLYNLGRHKEAIEAYNNLHFALVKRNFRNYASYANYCSNLLILQRIKK
ncbi:hypothetical protein D1BOALGB6SA_4336, partial [Olavius sp. associated proteobacterium Delta 1]